jgi:hypothetical protein
MGKDSESAFERAVKQIVGKMVKPDVLVGVAVNVTDKTCDIIRENAPELKQVRLNAIDDDLQTYITTVPAENSSVIVAIIEGERTEAIILKCSEVAKIIGKIGGSEFEMTGSSIVANSGQNGGVPNITPLIDWMGMVHNDLITLQSLLSSHLVAGNGAALAMVFNPTTPAPSQNQLEDTKVKH